MHCESSKQETEAERLGEGGRPLRAGEPWRAKDSQSCKQSEKEHSQHKGQPAHEALGDGGMWKVLVCLESTEHMGCCTR